MHTQGMEVLMSDLVVPSSADEARTRADRIRSGMRVLAEWQQDVIAAYAARDWAVLGYETWDAYLAGEYGEHRVRLPREQRREIVAGMAQAGMSTRAIGAAIGAGNATVHRDLAASGVPDETPAVQGIDGKSYAAFRPARETEADTNIWLEPGTEPPDVVDAELVDEVAPPKAKRRPLPEAFAEAGRDLTRAAERLDRLTEDDRFTRNRDTTHHQVPELLGALEHTARLIQAMNLPAAGASEEARRWWATSLNTISDTLRGVAHSIEQEQK